MTMLIENRFKFVFVWKRCISNDLFILVAPTLLFFPFSSSSFLSFSRFSLPHNISFVSIFIVNLWCTIFLSHSTGWLFIGWYAFDVRLFVSFTFISVFFWTESHTSVSPLALLDYQHNYNIFQLLPRFGLRVYSLYLFFNATIVILLMCQINLTFALTSDFLFYNSVFNLHIVRF